MAKLSGVKGFNYKRLAQEMSPEVPSSFDIRIPAHGTFTFGIGSDEFVDLPKERLIELVMEVYDGSGEAHKQDPSYWEKYPKIVLAAICGDTYGANQ